MLKKLLKLEEKDKTIFPHSHSNDNLKPLGLKLDELRPFIEQILSNHDFITEITQTVKSLVLDELLAKYNFEPTEKYMEEIELKKKYITKLDNYLQERRAINVSVENELQQFLSETQSNIGRALEAFSTNIQARIMNTQNQYGVDKIRQVLLTNEDHQQ
ncbi:MAG: hypothetical protein KBD37_03100 [Burkholderiales bacterium]|nr:hypothetical protein [Burkholderiales bacterium]